ncbi:MAG: hypothetical protein ACK4M7_02715 [Burkholderiales bacterium]
MVYALKAANSGLHRIVSLTSDLVDMEQNQELYFKARRQYMPSSAYTSASIGVSKLAIIASGAM